MQKGKKINVFTLLDEINGINLEIKNKYKILFDFVYNEMRWPYLKIKKNRTLLYSKIEKLINQTNSSNSI